MCPEKPQQNKDMHENRNPSPGHTLTVHAAQGLSRLESMSSFIFIPIDLPKDLN
jgi:hypothetical protein